MANNGVLTAKQEKALATLMTSTTVLDAAKKAGLGHRTLVRWLADDADFQAAYMSARRQAMSHAISQLQQSAGEAVAALREVMVDPELPANSRVSSAKVILELAMKGLELEDLERRIEALESIRRSSNGRAK
jgi:uncharacterized protein YggE